MWNRRSIILFIVAFILLIDIFPQDSVAVVTEEATERAAEEASEVFPHLFPDNLSQFQRGSIMAVIPKDTSSQTVQRHFIGSLADKYASDDALNYERNVSKSFFQRLRETLSAWINKLLGISDVSKINRLSDKILNVLLILIFLVALYIAVRLFMNHRGSWFFEKKNEVISVDLSNVEKHIHEADFEILLHKAEQDGDTRQSVRVLYLWVLKTFSDDDIIQWNPEKTNIDYLSEIEDKALQEQFRYLSYLYNYIWYGGFSIDGSEYQKARKTFFRHIKMKPENE